MNEQQRHDAFEKLCGGRTRAFQLKRIWDETNPSRGEDGWLLAPSEREERKIVCFRRAAKSQGFTREQVNAYIAL